MKHGSHITSHTSRFRIINDYHHSKRTNCFGENHADVFISALKDGNNRTKEYTQSQRVSQGSKQIKQNNFYQTTRRNIPKYPLTAFVVR
jgi:hypothetical protein